MAGIYLISINRSRYSAVSGGKNGFPSRAAISAAAHQRLDSLHVHCVHVHRPVYLHSVHSVLCIRCTPVYTVCTKFSTRADAGRFFVAREPKIESSIRTRDWSFGTEFQSWVPTIHYQSTSVFYYQASNIQYRLQYLATNSNLVYRVSEFGVLGIYWTVHFGICLPAHSK